MAIDTRTKRESALLDPWGMITPDGTINAADRASLLGQYGGVPGGSPPIADDPDPTCRFGATGTAKYGAEVTCG